MAHDREMAQSKHIHSRRQHWSEVTTQVDYVILYSGKSELLVQIKLTENMIPVHNYVMLF